MTTVDVTRTVGRQPLLSDATVVLSAPAQVWSRASGDVGEGAIDGVFFADTRFFRTMTLRCGGGSPEWISVAPDGASRVGFGGVLRDDDQPTPDPRVRILRHRLVTPSGLTETVVVRSHADRAVRTRVEIALEPDFASLTEVRMGSPAPRASTVVADPVDGADSLLVQSGHQSAVVRAPGAVRTYDGGRIVLSWDLDVAARGASSVQITIEMTDPEAVVAGVGDGTPLRRAMSDESPVGSWVGAATSDLQALRLVLPDSPDAFFAAGAPWFFTLFGRDSIWSARLLLPADASMAGSTLRVLARLQGTRTDARTAEQPGKILHELRSAPLTTPDGRVIPPVYYGTVDATALWVCLLHDAWQAGMPDVEVRALLPAMVGCLDWMLHHGDSDGDGFLDYHDATGTGLSNQGWKDSEDAIQWRDGTLAEGPIALCEVQGYAYEAAMSGARVLEAFHEPGAARLRSWAADLRERFAASYWVTTPEGRYPAIALDRDKRPVDSLTSNVGHLLGTGILDPADERAIADLLIGPTMLSGYGIRTLSSAAAGYWPLSYHGGSVWAHDTAIVARGMQRAGLGDHARRVAAELVTVAEGFGFRMPELHSGDPAADTTVPTPYPAACRPQAWAAAAAVTVADILRDPPRAPSARG